MRLVVWFPMLLTVSACGADTRRAPLERPAAPTVRALPTPVDAGEPADSAVALADATAGDAAGDAARAAAIDDPEASLPWYLPPGTVLRSGDACLKDADCTITESTVECCPCGVRATPRSQTALAAARAKLPCRPNQCAHLGSCSHGSEVGADRLRAACLDRRCAAIMPGARAKNAVRDSGAP